jgi:hypothetical protein
MEKQRSYDEISPGCYLCRVRSIWTDDGDPQAFHLCLFPQAFNRCRFLGIYFFLIANLPTSL